MIIDMNEDFLIRLNYVETSEPDRVAKELQQQDQQIEQLKHEVEELKKNAIVPKFRVGQKVFVVEPVFEKHTIELEITHIKYITNKETRYSFSGDYLVDVGFASWFKETELFSTQQEAEEALRKLEEV